MRIIISSVLIFLIIAAAHAQKQQYHTAIVAFYNLENFYDTVNNTLIDDEEFLPTGIRNYNSSIYWHKVGNLASVIAQLGTDINPDGPAILGVAEIENDTVLNDLLHHALLKEKNYHFIHYDSKDARGVDVALIYNPAYFIPIKSKRLFVALPYGAKEAVFTRDALWVSGKLEGEQIEVLVNHWPSRKGGEDRSAPGRLAAAAVNKHIADSLRMINPAAKIIVMGDLNDDPVNKSITEGLSAKAIIADTKEYDLYNPWIELYKKGIGTLAYNDAWGLFDQIMFSNAWLDKQQQGLFFYRPFIFNKNFMKENTGKYRGYPMRTWDGNMYRGGYSDHFPVYVAVVKRK